MDDKKLDEEVLPLEVKVMNKPDKKESTAYDSQEDPEYVDLSITKEQEKEFENGDT